MKVKPRKPSVQTTKRLFKELRLVTDENLEAQFGCYIGSMLTLCWPPFTEQEDEALYDATVFALQPYILEMQGFDRDALRNAWQSLVVECSGKGWPDLRDLKAAADAVMRKREASPTVEIKRTERQISAHAQRLAAGFWQHYQAGDQWKAACEEGWSLDLMRYVGERVDYQSRILARANGGPPKLPDSPAVRRHYQTDLMDREGRIEVDVPQDLVAQWRAKVKPAPKKEAVA